MCCVLRERVLLFSQPRTSGALGLVDAVVCASHGLAMSANETREAIRNEQNATVDVLLVWGELDDIWRTGEASTLAFWAKRNGCPAGLHKETVSVTAAATRRVYRGCRRGRLENLVLHGVGHVVHDVAHIASHFLGLRADARRAPRPGEIRGSPHWEPPSY